MSRDDADDLVMFISDKASPASLGTDTQYGKTRDYFTRRKEEVGTELDRLVTQMQDLVDKLSVRMQLFELSEVGFELGFSAEGHLGFIAKAGAHGTVQVTFTRRAKTPDNKDA